MDLTIKGDLAPHVQNQHWEYDPSRGYTLRADFSGASQVQMLSLWNSYVNQGIAAKLDYNQGGTARLDIEDSTLNVLIDKWEILANEEARDGLSHPAILQLATDDQISLMRQHLADNDTPATAFTGDPGLYSLAGTAAPGFYTLHQRGSNEYRRGQYVLRHTSNVPNRWAVNVADVGVDRIYTPAQLFSETTNPYLWRFPLPGRLQYKLAAIPAPTAKTDYLWGWLKSASSETTAANNRVDIVTEYTLEQWSTLYYTPY